MEEAKAEAEDVAAAKAKRDEHEARCPAVAVKFYQLREIASQDFGTALPGDEGGGKA